MLKWMFDRSWARARATMTHNNREAAAFVLRPNKLYKATVTLTGLETWASNDMVAAKFSELGFKKPRVTGSGGVRQGEALWPGQEKSVPLPIDPHLSNIAEVA